MIVSHQEENMELKRQKNCAEDYVWSDYLQLPFTQNVSL